MSLSLILQLKPNKIVLVSNSETQEQKEVTLGFLQEITRDSLLMLIQYKRYELIINAEQHWNNVKKFNPEVEKNKEIYIEQKFRDIMVNDSWMTITDYDREMYQKALAWASSYSSQPNYTKIDKSAKFAAGSGAVGGALVSHAIGGIGIAAGGTAFGLGMLGLTTLGTIAGLAAYGIGKAVK
jgi:hypothetical protein